MCDFFSCDSDGKGKLFYIGGEDRRRVKALGGSPDSHTTIAVWFGFKGEGEDKLNKYEYNPLQKVLTVDTMPDPTLDDRDKVLEALNKLDFNKIAPDEYQAMIKKEEERKKKAIREAKQDDDRKRRFAPGYVCRVRTAEELKEIYGENWRNVVNFNTSGKMDYLLGQKFTVKSVSSSSMRSEEDIESRGESRGVVGQACWYVDSRSLEIVEAVKPKFTMEQLFDKIGYEFEIVKEKKDKKAE